MTRSILSKLSSRTALLPMTVCLAVTVLGCSSSTSTPGRVDAGDLGGGGRAAGIAGAGGITGSGGMSSAEGTGGIAADAGVDTSTGGTTSGVPDVQPATYTLSGVAQKGPFGNGTNVNIAECNDSLVPTGRTFSTSIVDNTGLFSLPNVQLSGKYVRLTADGFYFDEVANQLSVSRIALNAVVDVTNRPTVNVNLLTHLEQPRLEYLLAQGSTFADAKTQAQREVLAIFGFALSSPALSETLDIARGTDDDAVLLAASVILQGRRTPGELTELLSNIGTDLRADGVVNSTESGTALMNGAVLLNLAAVRSNLVARYATLSVTATIGDFEKYVQAFISSAKYPFTDVIVYPPTGAHGPNFLDPTRTTYPLYGGPNTTMGGSFRADLPRGASLKVVLTRTSDRGTGVGEATNSGWTITASGNTGTFTISSSANAQSGDVNYVVSTGVCVRVEYYENFEITGAATPTATKEVCAEAGASPDGGRPRSDGGTDAPTATDGGTDVPSDAEETADGGEVIDG